MSYTLPMNIACPKCGWYGNDPDQIGTHAPCDVCPVCRPLACQDFYHPSGGERWQEYEKDYKIGYDNTMGPGSLVWMYGKEVKGKVLQLSGKNMMFRVLWDDGSETFHDKKDLHRITRCTSSVPYVHHKWEQYDLMDDICTECGEIAHGSTAVGGVVYPKTSCPGKPRR